MRRLLAIVVSVVMLLAACGGSGGTESTSQPEPDAEPIAAPTPEPAATPEPTAPPEPERDFSAVTEAAQAFVDDAGLEGAALIIVERDQGVLYHEAFGDFSEDRISMVASSSKMISAGVLLRLQEDNLLDIDAPISDATGWPDDHPDMRPVQLISNSSGLVGLGPDLLYAPYLCQWLPGPTLAECGEQIFDTVADDADIIMPDTEFRYGGAQWQVAGAIAESVSGKSWAQLVDEIYVQPCGVDTLGYQNILALGGAEGYPVGFAGDPDLHEPPTNPSIEAGVHISVGDYGTLLLMHLRGGQCEGGQVLSQESLDRMHSDRVVSYDGDAGANTGYGMGWWVDRETGIISDGGLWGSLPWLNLEAGYGAYWVIEDDFSTTGRFSEELTALVHEAVTGSELEDSG